MVECFRCGTSISSSDMLECIHKTGVVYVCHECYPKLRIPIVERKKVDWASLEERKPVRERLSKIANVQVEEKKNVFETKKNPEDMTLRDIVERNFDKNKLVAKEVPTELVDNFNWVIMRKRRGLKMSLSELSERIHEPEVIVSSLEKGLLPKDYAGIIRKVESTLGIRLFKDFRRDIGSDDIVAESKVPTGILLSEVKEKSKGFMNWFKKKGNVSAEKIDAALREAEKEEEIDVNKLDLKKVEDVFGKPIKEEIKPNKPKIEGNDKEKEIARDWVNKREEKKIEEDLMKSKNSETKVEESNLSDSDEDVELSQDEIDNLIWRS